jgi:hypothetical protein
LDRFVRKYWEIPKKADWRHYIQNTTDTDFYQGRTDVIHWGTDGEIIGEFPGSFIKGKNAWKNNGLRVTQMRELPITLYTGEIFGKNAATIVPHNPAHLPAIWCFCSSPDYNEAVRRIDQKLNVTNATLVKVPFDLAYWSQVAAERYPNGLPKPYSDDPTQWLFHGHPVPATDPLQVAVARLLGYRWPAELQTVQAQEFQAKSASSPRQTCVSSYQQYSNDAGAADTNPPAMELSGEAHAWIARCAPLIQHTDDDGIVCLQAVRGEQPAYKPFWKAKSLTISLYAENRWPNKPLAITPTSMTACA